MCDNKATSVEHVPPQCLFPEIKDSKEDLRVNLITVPSCDEHNQKKSKDDEFLMVSLAGIIGNNSIGYEHYHGKVQRTLKRNSYRLLEKVLFQKQTIRLPRKNSFIELIVGKPDYERLCDCFIHIAYGVHRYHFQKNFKGTVKPFLGFLHNTEKNPRAFKALIEEKAHLELADKPKHGENPKVFYYQFTDADQFGLYLAKFCFYQNVNIYASYQPIGAKEPFDLGMLLINEGMHTVIEIGDKKFEFNSQDDVSK